VSCRYFYSVATLSSGRKNYYRFVDKAHRDEWVQVAPGRREPLAKRPVTKEPVILITKYDREEML
jgi:hypothetical protein